MLPPLIGVTAEDYTNGNIIAPEIYVRAVQRAGGIPLVIPVHLTDLAALMARLDGLVVSGGPDLDPALYNGLAHPAVYGVHTERDEAEIALLRLAIAAGLPTLCICRGLQTLNVALGGSLIEHLPDESSGAIVHRQEPPGWSRHRVAVQPGSQLAAALGVTVAEVASWHHQALRTVAPGLVVTATAADGTLEAAELPSHPWLVAVQWHPEASAATDPVQQRLFDTLIQRARLPHPPVHESTELSFPPIHQKDFPVCDSPTK
jgi:putative glutamine amidotransferase